LVGNTSFEQLDEPDDTIITPTRIIGSTGAKTPTLDRFVPWRSHDTSVVERYNTTKPLSALSLGERLTRQDLGSADPFVTTSPPRISMSYNFPTLPRARTQTRLDNSIIGARISNHDNPRQASHGAVWTVGGTAPSTLTVDDGRGHLLQSGTNARVFTASFLEKKVNKQEDADKYHDRIALALKVDRARRMLNFSPQLRVPRQPPFSQTWNLHNHQKTT
jgi:meiosis-specific APC/C activator protein AMA1